METGIAERFPALLALSKQKGISDLRITLKKLCVFHDGTFVPSPSTAETRASFDPTLPDPRKEFVHSVMEALVPCSGVGDQFRTFFVPKLVGTIFPHGMMKATQIHGETADPEPHPGELTVLLLWVSVTDFCVCWMRGINEMVIKHPEWAGKAEFLGVSFDPNVDKLKARLGEKGLSAVARQYHVADDGVKQKLTRHFTFQSVPYVIIVDQKGTVRCACEPGKIDLEKSISNLVSGSGDIVETLPVADPPHALKDKSYSFLAAKKDLEDFTSAEKAALSSVRDCVIGVRFDHVSSAEGLNNIDAYLLVRFGWHNEKDRDELSQKLEKAFGSRLEIVLQLHRLYRLKFAETCSVCKSPLGECDQYLCGGVAACAGCFESGKAVEAGKQICCYFVQKGSAGLLDQVRIGDAEFASLSVPGQKCGFCRKSVPVGAGWRCAICPGEVKMCTSCFTEACSVPEVHVKESDHNIKTHVYARLGTPAEQ